MLDTEIDKITKTSALLGYLDIAIDEENRPYSNDSIIGSQPTPMDPNSPIPSEFIHCKNCNKPMRLLLQCSAELENTWYDRSIYVFICIEGPCRRQKGVVRAIRGIKKDKILIEEKKREEKERILKEKQREEEIKRKEKEKKEKAMGLFGKSNEKGNPFSSNPFASSGGNLNPFGTKSNENPFAMKSVNEEIKKVSKDEDNKPKYAQVVKKNINVSQEVKQAHHIELPQFPGFILYFEGEVLDPKNQVLAPLPDNLVIQEDGTLLDDNVSMHSAKSGNLPKVNVDKAKEGEEIARMVDDQTFQNFTRIISYNTSQIVRYDLNGQPLLYSSTDELSKIFYSSSGKLKSPQEWNIPSASYNPSGSRRFELQLMPKLIFDLEKDSNIDILRDGMEWGTIIVATDSDDIAPENWLDENGVVYLEEWCGVQWEELTRI